MQPVTCVNNINPTGAVEWMLLTKNVRSVLQALLLASFAVSFIAGGLLSTLALYVIGHVGVLVENYLDAALKNSNLTTTLVARYGALVPTKDYLPVEFDPGPWLVHLPLKVLEMGTAIVAFSTFGVVAVKLGKPRYMYMLMGCLSVALLGQLLFIWNLTDPASSLHRGIRRRLVWEMKRNYEFGAEAHNQFTFAFNGIMLMGECCGVNNPRDFTMHRHTFVHTGPNNVTHNATLIFPLACCKRHYIEQGFYSALQCALSWSEGAINHRGCYQTMYSYLSAKFGPTLMWIYLIITYIELLQIFICVWLTWIYREEQRRAPLSVVTAQWMVQNQHFPLSGWPQQPPQYQAAPPDLQLHLGPPTSQVEPQGQGDAHNLFTALDQPAPPEYTSTDNRNNELSQGTERNIPTTFLETNL